ncbi:MAG: hypothetical protein CMK59_07100 [Proteobacteria bacterium]|nr:hypothetical protein [Pseudomonadota bacterium]
MNSSVHTSERQDLQNQITRLHENRDLWKNMSAQEKLSILNKMLENTQNIDHQQWGKASIHQQGYDPESSCGQQLGSSEQMVNAATIVGTLRSLIRTYTSLSETEAPPILTKMTDRTDSRTVLKVFPYDFSDKVGGPLGVAGVTGELWIEEGQKPTQSFNPNGKLSLVLGAGNQSFLAFGDVMHEMFIKGNLCILKHHPVRGFSAPFYEQLFSDLIDAGFFISVKGDIELSQWLCHHEFVQAVHMTGGTATHDAIVWGPHPEQNENKKNNTPVLKKTMTSELGCITPWIICSGAQWTDKELEHHAQHLAMSFISQNSCNCLSPKLLVLDEDWPQKHIFIEHLKNYLAKAPTPPPYYPGTEKRYSGFKDAYTQAEIELISSPTSPARNHDYGAPLPWMLLHLTPQSDRYALQNEAFAPILAIYSFKGENRSDVFLEKAVDLVNNHVWGTLSCTLIAHKNIQNEHPETVEKAISDLRYGAIAVNSWTAMVYTMDGCVWGAYPGEKLDNVASGIGFVRNAFMVDHIEKAVLRAPFINSAQLKISKSGTSPLSAVQFQALSNLVVRPNAWNMAKVGWHMAFSKSN